MADNDNHPVPDREVRHQGASHDDRRGVPIAVLEHCDTIAAL
jgi:hypothetical protein